MMHADLFTLTLGQGIFNSCWPYELLIQEDKELCNLWKSVPEVPVGGCIRIPHTPTVYGPALSDTGDASFKFAQL